MGWRRWQGVVDSVESSVSIFGAYLNGKGSDQLMPGLVQTFGVCVHVYIP